MSREILERWGLVGAPLRPHTFVDEIRQFANRDGNKGVFGKAWFPFKEFIQRTTEYLFAVMNDRNLKFSISICVSLIMSSVARVSN